MTNPVRMCRALLGVTFRVADRHISLGWSEGRYSSLSLQTFHLYEVAGGCTL